MKLNDNFLTIDAKSWRLSIFGPSCRFGSFPLRQISQAEVFADGRLPQEFALAGSVSERLLGISLSRAGNKCSSFHCETEIWNTKTLERRPWGMYTLPLMVEETSYDLLLEWEIGRGDSYGQLVVDAGITELSRGRSSASFRYERSSYVGHFYLQVALGGSTAASLVLLVVSSKLDFFTERKAMLRELNEANRALATRLFQPTTGSAKHKGGEATEIEFASNLSRRISDAISYLKRLEDKRLSGISREARITPEHRLRRISEASAARLERDVGVEREGGKLLADIRIVTRDTSENRHALRLCRDLLNRGLAAERRMNLEKSVATKPAFVVFSRNLKKLRAATRSEYWSGVRVPDDSEVLPVSALFHSEISRLGKLYRETRSGLDTERVGAARISLMAIDAQYETWVLLKILRCMTDVLGVPPIRPPILRKAMFSHLEVGIGSEMRLPHGVSVFFKPSLIPNKSATRPLEQLLRTPLVEQEPDSLVVSFAGRKCIVLDAKYSIRPLKGSIESLATSTYTAGMFGPSSDSINAMHRYRDAIRDGLTGESAVVFAGALFPGDVTYKHDALDSSIRNGIGAVPIRPDNEAQLDYLRSLLKRLVSEQLASTHQKALSFDGPEGTLT